MNTSNMFQTVFIIEQMGKWACSSSNITQIHFFQCIFYISCMYFCDVHDVHDVHIKNSLLLGIHMTPYFSNKKAQFI